MWSRRFIICFISSCIESKFSYFFYSCKSYIVLPWHDMSFYYYYYYNKLLIFSLKSEIFWNKPIARYSRLPNNINFPLQFITSNKIVAKNPSINYARYIFISADFIGFFIMSSRTLCRMHANAIHNEKKILIHFCFVLFYFFPCIFFFFKCIRSVGPKIDLKHDNWACLFVCFVLDQRIVKERSLTCWIAVVFCMSELKIQFNLHANSQHFSLCIWTKKKFELNSVFVEYSLLYSNANCVHCSSARYSLQHESKKNWISNANQNVFSEAKR